MDFQEFYKFQDIGFTKHVGIKVVDLKDGYACGEMEIKPEHLNPIGTIHGGAVFTLADTIGGFAAVTKSKRCTTVRSDINYINPTFNVKKLVAKATVLKAGKRMIIVEITIEDQEENMLSKAMMTYFRLKEDGRAV